MRMYQVATYDNNFGGTFHGVQCIIMIPYMENKSLWANDYLRPYDFFLVFPKDAIELEK